MARKLTKREKYAIYALSGAVCLFVLIQFFIFPAIDKQERLERTLQVKEKMLREMITLKSEYNTIHQQANSSKQRFKNRKKGFTLFSFLNGLIDETGIKEHVTYMKPSTKLQKDSPYKISKVEMKLQGLTLQELTNYLYMVESSKNMVNISRISIIKTGKQEGFIDAVLQVETIEK